MFVETKNQSTRLYVIIIYHYINLSIITTNIGIFSIDMREIGARDVLFHKLKKHLKLSCCVTGEQL